MTSPSHARAMAAAIERLPPAWFKPRAAVYWSDMLASAGVGWLALALSVASHGLARAPWLLLATLALYRAALFIHEVAHLAPGDIPCFKTAWNVLVGIPILLPSFLYEGVHLDHHRPQHYGTRRDPEYVPFRRQSPRTVLTFLAGSTLLPLALAVRFGILAPLSWMIPALRRATLAHASSLVINPGYVRREKVSSAGLAQEIACAALVWTILALWRDGILATAAVSSWFLVLSSASIINGVRTLAAHRYAHEDGEREFTTLEQLLDTCTLAGDRPLQMLCAPVGLRYHALHHWIPSLPYHNLRRGHRRLTSSLPPGEPYHDTVVRSILGAIADLLAGTRNSR